MRKILCAAAVIISTTATAQNDSAVILNEVIVTANKIEQKQSETGKVLTIISRAELEKSNGRQLGDLLNEQVGITVGGANNNPGANQTIFVRGASAPNTLIMLDGVPLYDPSGVSSEFDLNTFSADQIERIEILKGAQSTLYGSDAVAGVINIISRKSDKLFTLSGNIGAGSFGNVRAGIYAGGKVKKFGYNISYSLFSNDGISSALDTTRKAGFDKDAFEKHVAQVSLSYQLSSAFLLRTFGKYNINKASIDANGYTDDRDYTYTTENAITGVNAEYKVGKSFVRGLYTFSAYDRLYLDDSSDIAGTPYALSQPFDFIYQKGDYRGKSHYAELYSGIHVSDQINLVVGGDYRRSKTEQNYTYALKDFGVFSSLPLNDDTASAYQYSGYASLLYKHNEKLSIGAGGRFNHHSVYGNVATFSFNPSFTSGKMKVFANVSSAYRVPSLYQLYGEFGNRELKPERSVNYEAGVQYNQNKFSGRLVGFHREIKDVFTFYTDPVTYAGKYINDDRQKDNGAELEIAAAPISKLLIKANYTYTTGEIQTTTALGKDTSYFNLFRRPKHMINASISFQATSKFLIKLYGKNVSSFLEARYGMTPLEIDGYTVINLYSEFRPNKHIALFADFRNIFDKKYADQPGFATLPFNIHGGLTFTF